MRTEPPPDASAADLARLQAREHPDCFACGPSHAAAPRLGLRFAPDPSGDGVEATWNPPPWTISYDDTVHGGLLATALDCAMVHALFARDLVARTAELGIRFRHPVRPDAPCRLHARITGRRAHAYRLEASLRQADRLCASATATFFANT